MSQPQTMLGKFDTYAYHHILMVCNCTTAAEDLAQTDEITTYQHPRNPALRYKARDIGTTGGKYVTLIDGLSDSRFYITDVRWTNYIADDPEIGKGNIAQSTTMSTDGEMELVEPLGASFLNRLTDIADELDSDPVGLVFLLKTIFVGRNTNGFTEMISTVRPMMFVAIDITAVFQSSGAKYKIEFVGLTNGAGTLPQPQKIFEGLSFNMVPSSLADTIKALETNVNKKYIEFKIKAIKDFAKTFTELDEGDAIAESAKFLFANYRDVKYKIILDEVYKTDRYKGGDNDPVRILETTEGSTVNFGPSVKVSDMLSKIMSACTGVHQDSKGKGTPTNKTDNKPLKYIFKVISVIRSTPEEYVVEYHIKRFLQATQAYETSTRSNISLSEYIETLIKRMIISK